MDRTQFETVRDLPGKRIDQDIRFARRAALAPVVVAEDIRIGNGAGLDLVLTIHFNSVTLVKTFNVHVRGSGPICRLDVDGPAHRPVGRSHKHALQGERCPERNLPDGVVDRSDLSGRRLREVFGVFCELARITHVGTAEWPDEGGA